MEQRCTNRGLQMMLSFTRTDSGRAGKRVQAIACMSAVEVVWEGCSHKGFRWGRKAISSLRNTNRRRQHGTMECLKPIYNISNVYSFYCILCTIYIYIYIYIYTSTPYIISLAPSHHSRNRDFRTFTFQCSIKTLLLNDISLRDTWS